MATFSTHLLNSIDGTHAKNLDVIIYQINTDGNKKKFLETKTDDHGRILNVFDLSVEDCKCEYEMICKIGNYFSVKRIVSDIVIRFNMPEQNKKYHIPIIISPNGYSTWWSN